MPAAAGAFALTYLMIMGIFLLPALLMGLAIPYAVLRIRDTREDHSDPQVGIKSGLYFFYSLGLLMMLNGATVIVTDLVMGDDNPQQLFPWQQNAGPANRPAPAADDDFPNAAQRTGGAFILSGLLFAIIHLFYVKVATNDAQFPAAGRIFLGWRLAIHGLVVFWTMTFLIVMLVQKEEPPAEAFNLLLGVLLVWAPSWFVHLSLLRAKQSEYYRPPARRYGRSEDQI